MREQDGLFVIFLISVTKASKTAGPGCTHIFRLGALECQFIHVSNTQSLPSPLFNTGKAEHEAGGGNRNPAVVGIDVHCGTSLDVHVSCGRQRVDYLPFLPVPVLSK